MIITITSIGEAIQEKKGKSQWSSLPVKYSGDQGDKERIFRSFGPDWGVAKTLKEGISYDVKLKKDGSFWVWESVTEVDPNTPRAKSSGGGGGNNQGYWDERFTLDKERFEFEKEKQPYIVRQSSLSTAVDFVKSCLDEQDRTMQTVLDVAKQFEEYVFSKEDLKQMEVE